MPSVWAWDDDIINDQLLQLIWVSPEMVELLVEVADTVPDDLELVEAQPPCVRGLVLFGQPVQGTDGFSGERVVVSGQMWGPIQIRELNILHEGIGISSFNNDPHIIEKVFGANPPYKSFSLGRTEWLEDESLNTYAERNNSYYQGGVTPPNPDALAQSAIEDRRLLVALWTLMADEKAAEHSQWVPRGKSSHRKGPPSPVTVVHLRREATASGDRIPAGYSSNFSHQWWVKPHIRMQPFGPQRALRRPTLIAGHVKGPKDKPFVRKERVWSLDK